MIGSGNTVVAANSEQLNIQSMVYKGFIAFKEIKNILITLTDIKYNIWNINTLYSIRCHQQLLV